ncbi:MAG TPA: VOC family protein [Sporichthyaceae bacterium]|jgi:predicted enzyme related to lactoylglutathione lyase
MDVLAGRILLHPVDRARSVRFYRDVLGLAVAREFGPAENPGTVFFLGNGLLEISAAAAAGPPAGFALWLQVRDVKAEHARLQQAGVPVLREPRTEPWGLIECWIADPDGVRVVLVEVPPEHPLRRDLRT